MKLCNTFQGEDFRQWVHDGCLGRDGLTRDGIAGSEVDHRNRAARFANGDILVGLKGARTELDIVSINSERRVHQLFLW